MPEYYINILRILASHYGCNKKLTVHDFVNPYRAGTELTRFN